MCERVCVCVCEGVFVKGNHNYNTFGGLYFGCTKQMLNYVVSCFSHQQLKLSCFVSICIHIYWSLQTYSTIICTWYFFLNKMHLGEILLELINISRFAFHYIWLFYYYGTRIAQQIACYLNRYIKRICGYTSTNSIKVMKVNSMSNDNPLPTIW